MTTINNQWAIPWASCWAEILPSKTKCSQEIIISMAHATTTLPCAFLPKIMLDKPQITEKLTNAWHLLNIHYSDTSSEFQKAERMLNQHSYSQSELQHHIAARLSADENGTLGPDSKNVQGLLTRELCLCVCVCVCVNKREALIVFSGERCFTLYCLSFSFLQISRICPVLLILLLLSLWKPYKELNGILKRGVIITSQFIHNIAQKDTEDSHIPSLFILPFLHQLSWGTSGRRTGVPSRPMGRQARPERAAHHFQF